MSGGCSRLKEFGIAEGMAEMIMTCLYEPVLFAARALGEPVAKCGLGMDGWQAAKK
jgi:hypothetical protein